MIEARPNATSYYNKSGLNSTIKQQIFSDWVSKYNQTTWCLRDIRNVERYRKHINEKKGKEKSGKWKNRDSNIRQNINEKDMYFTLIKCTVHRETVAVVPLCTH